MRLAGGDCNICRANAQSAGRRRPAWAETDAQHPWFLYVSGVPSEESAEEHFARFTLDGDRFAGARLPIDALVELQRYREMVLEAARQAWFADHPGQSIPDDFDREFDLAISDVEDGSATPVMDKPASPYDTYYATGRDELETAFAEIINTGFEVDLVQVSAPDQTDEDDAAVRLEPPLFQFPERIEPLTRLVDLPAFRAFGSSLRPDEALRLEPSIDHEPVEVTASTGATVIRAFVELVERLRNPASEQPDEVRSDKYVSTVAGRLFAMNADKKNFDMDTLHFGKVHGSYKDAEMTTNLRAVLDSSAQAPLVRVTGRMSWRDGSLYRILSVDELELLEIETEPWSRRVVELASLPPNWHPEIDSSPVISFVAIDAARDVLRDVEGLPPVPGIFPLEDGGVLVEWSTPERVVSLEISPDAGFLLFHLDVATEEATETETDDISVVKEIVRGALA